MKQAFIYVLYDQQEIQALFLELLHVFCKKHKSFVFLLGKDIHPKLWSKKKSLEKLGIYIIDLKTSIIQAEWVIEKISKKFNIIAINTTFNPFVENIHTIQKRLWKEVSSDPQLLTNKFKQRNFIYKNSPEISIKFQQKKISELNYESICNFIWKNCFILKPLNRAESQGVVKIDSEQELAAFQAYNNYSQEEYLAEEYLPGRCYALDYYVDSEWKISFWFLLENTLAEDIGCEGFFLLSVQTLQEKLEDELYIKLEKLIKTSVKSLWVRNTFICQDVILLPNGEFQNLEFNGRIWWRHPEIIYEAFNVSLPELAVYERPTLLPPPLKKYAASFRIFATSTGILQWFNQDMIQKLQELPSFSFIELQDDMIGKIVGSPKDGYSNLWKFFIKTPHKEEFSRDMDFILKHYKDIVEVENNN